jgi:hypothetical protein
VAGVLTKLRMKAAETLSDALSAADSSLLPFLPASLSSLQEEDVPGRKAAVRLKTALHARLDWEKRRAKKVKYLAINGHKKWELVCALSGLLLFCGSQLLVACFFAFTMASFTCRVFLSLYLSMWCLCVCLCGVLCG